MELRQLEYFVAVAEERNFTRAAERVYITQSGVSAQVRQLERELGAELIDRRTRVARLTPAGAAALDAARAALAAAAEIRHAVNEVNELLRGRLVVAMVTACTVEPLFTALAEFHRAHPGVDVALHEDTSDRMVEQIRSGAVDVALVGCVGAPPADLDAREITRDRLVALASPDHPLAAQHRVPLRALVAYPLVSLPHGSGIRGVLDRACAAIGVEPEVAVEASAPDAVANLARRGLGIAVLSESMTTQHEGELIRIPISGVKTRAVLALVWKRGTNPAVRELRRCCETAFGLAPAA